MTVIKIRPLAPAEQLALERAHAVVEKLCGLYRTRLDPTKPLPSHIKQASDELENEFFEVQALLRKLPSLKNPPAQRELQRKPLSDEYKMLFLGAGEHSAAEAYNLEKLLRRSIESLGGLQQGVSKDDPGWHEVERNAATIYTALTGKHPS